VQKNDRDKREAMKRKKYTLITVPCWWDGRKESLIATIRLERPDLLTQRANISNAPISNTPPPDFFKVNEVPQVGELMAASFLPRTGFDIENWWMGEKFDGIRACWNPNTEKIYSRNGKPLAVSKEILHSLPGDLFLDGELWTGRGTFTVVMPIVHFTKRTLKKAKSREENHGQKSLFLLWNLLRMVAFDVPSRGMQKERVPFESRYSHLLNNVEREHPFIFVAPRVTRNHAAHMETYARAITAGGGEGVILRKPQSLYENGRSHLLLKYKTHRDGEALVVGIQGIYYTCKLPNKQKLVLRKSSKMSPDVIINLNNIVSYRYRTIGKKLTPLNAIIYRVREDLSWEDVLIRYNKNNKN